MCSELKLVEVLDVNSKISSKFPTDVSENDYICLVTKSGALIYRLCALKTNTLPNISFHKQLIPPSTFVLSVNLGIEIESFFISLPQSEVYECVLRGDISAGLDVCEKKEFIVIAAKWSPFGLIGLNCIIGIINDAGSLDLYFRIIEGSLIPKYHHLLNVTLESIEHYKHEWNTIDYCSPSEILNEFKRRISMHAPTVFTWTHIFKNCKEHYCYLIVATLNGTISFWKFKCKKMEDYADTKIEFVADLKTGTENITALHWKPSSNGALLFFGNYVGTIMVVPIKNITENSVEFGSIINFASEENIKIEHIDSFISYNLFYVYAIKGSYLVIYLFDKEGNVIDSCNFNAGNLNITDINYLDESKLLVLCETGVLKELKISSDNKKIFIHWRHIYLNINWTLKKAYGLFSSKNKILFGLLTDSCRVFNVKQEKFNFNLIMLYNKAKDPMDIILNNPTNTLRDYYDCLEVARITAIINKELLCEKLPQIINYDDLSLIQLKTYYYLAKVSEFIYDQLETVHNYNIKSCADILVMIEIKLAVNLMRLLLDENVLDFNKKRCLNQLNSYLREIVMEDKIIKLQLGNNYVEDIFDVLARTQELNLDEIGSVCAICDNDIIGSLCINNHYDNRCAFSMLQISNPKYRCPFCKRSISEEVVKFLDVMTCPFCDVEIDYILRGYGESFVNNSCKSDCLLPIETNLDEKIVDA